MPRDVILPISSTSSVADRSASGPSALKKRREEKGVTPLI